MNFRERVQFSAPSFFREGKILKDIKLNEIEMNGEKYPFYCDLNVLELIQDNFKSVNQFERDILGLSPIRDEDGEVKRNDKGEILHEQIEPRIKAVAFGVFVMIREGQRIREREIMVFFMVIPSFFSYWAAPILFSLFSALSL